MRGFSPMPAPAVLPEGSASATAGIEPACPHSTSGGPDLSRGTDCAPGAFALGFGGGRAPAAAGRGPVEGTPRAAATPVNAGFRALGPAGSTGKVDGPGRQGNGSYRVLRNDPFLVELTVRTGYVDGTTTLSRDRATGRDTMRFVGRVWDRDAGRFSEPQDVTAEVQISYDAGRDRGLIRWQEDGVEKQEGYWGGGRAGARTMTIELGGGWDHDFTRD